MTFSQYRPFGYEKVYLPLCKVADTPFYIDVCMLEVGQTIAYPYYANFIPLLPLYVFCVDTVPIKKVVISSLFVLYSFINI